MSFQCSNCRWRLILTLIACLLTPAAYSQTNMDMPYHMYTWVTAHNSHASSGHVYPWSMNQWYDMYDQLKNDQVRGLMIDIEYGNGVRLTHSDDAGSFKYRMKTEVARFLNEEPNAVLFFDIEVAGDLEKSQLQDAMNSLPDITSRMFNPKHAHWRNHNEWPTIREMVDANQRVIMIIDTKSLAGDYNNFSILYRPDVTAENCWAVTNNSCAKRHKYGEHKINISGKEWSRLFTMNHFGTTGDAVQAQKDNNWDGLYPRIINYCIPKAELNRKPNFLAVDFVTAGDPQEIAEVLTEGGIIFYEGNDATQNIVCGLGTGISRTVNAKSGNNKGCENDEARSAVLRGVRAGTKIVVYGNPDGDHREGRAIIRVKRDVDNYVIRSFHDNVNNEFVQVEAHLRGQLDGKISRFEITANEGPGTFRGKPFNIVTRLNNKCLDVDKPSLNVQVWGCSGGSNQQWLYDFHTAQIKSSSNNLCLDAAAFNGNLYMRSCYGGNNQKWDLLPSGVIRERHHNQCIDVYQFNQSDGANVKMHDCNNYINQKWFTGIGYTKVIGFNNKCLDVDRGTLNVQMWDCNDRSDNQRWILNMLTGEIRSGSNEKCLDAASRNGNAYMYDCHGGANQQWVVTPKGQIQDRHHGQCLDVYRFNNDNGANVTMHDCNSNANQKWNWKP